jgi:hypothetical protein
MSIRDFFNRIFNKKKQLPAGRNDEYYKDYKPRSETRNTTTRGTVARNTTNRSTASRNTSKEFKSQYHVDIPSNNSKTRNTHEHNLERRTRQENRPHREIYTGSYSERYKAQQQAKQIKFRKKVALGLASFVLATGCANAYADITYAQSYEHMSIQKLAQVLDKDTLSQEEILDMADALQADGLESLKEKVVDVLNPIHKDITVDDISFSTGYAAPALMKAGQSTYTDIRSAFDEKQNNTLSEGLVSVIDSTAYLQGNKNLTQIDLAQYIELLEDLDSSELNITDNYSAGASISTNNEENLINHSLVENTKQIEQDDDER